MPEEEKYPILVTTNGNYYEIDEEKNVTYVENSEIVTITKIYDDETTETQMVKKGNNYGLISYKKKEGELFMGWTKSPDSINALASVVDFSDVSEDMTVYANYTSENYAQIKYLSIYNSSNIIETFYIVTARPLFSDSTGLVMNYNGTMTQCDTYKVKDSMLFQISNGTNIISYTARDMFELTYHGNIGVYEMPISEFSEGTEITYYPSFITKDGTKVEGTERTIIWHQNYQELTNENEM